jgi:hypothetical protein
MSWLWLTLGLLACVAQLAWVQGPIVVNRGPAILGPPEEVTPAVRCALEFEPAAPSVLEFEPVIPSFLEFEPAQPIPYALEFEPAIPAALEFEPSPPATTHVLEFEARPRMQIVHDVVFVPMRSPEFPPLNPTLSRTLWAGAVIESPAPPIGTLPSTPPLVFRPKLPEFAICPAPLVALPPLSEAVQFDEPIAVDVAPTKHGR